MSNFAAPTCEPIKTSEHKPINTLPSVAQVICMPGNCIICQAKATKPVLQNSMAHSIKSFWQIKKKCSIALFFNESNK